MIKLRRLKINKYRNIEPCELFFNDNFNVLLGKNATGKTTLLKLLTAVLSTDFERLEEMYDLECEFDIEGYQIIVHGRGQADPTAERLEDMANKVEDIFLEDGDELERVASVEIKNKNLAGMRFEKSGDVASWFDKGQKIWGMERFRFSGSVLAMAFNTVPHIPVGADDIRHSLRLRGPVYRFDETDQTFKSMTQDIEDDDLDEDLMPTATLAMSVDRSSLEVTPYFHSSFPESLRSTLKNIGRKNIATSDLIFSHHDLGFLNNFVKLNGFHSASLKLNFFEKVADDNLERYEFGPLTFLFERGDGSVVSHDHLSYGQKRFLSFLYYSESCLSFIICDELVNGLHHQWIESCMSNMSDKQSFFTSQNPILFDYIPVESSEIASKTFIVCERISKERKEMLRWKNMSPEHAEELYAAYEVGVETLGQILETRGYW